MRPLFCQSTGSMDDKEKLKDRLVELRQLVDEEESEDDGIKNVVSDFGRAPLGCELRPFQIEGASYLVNGEPGKVLAMIIQPGLGKSLSYIIHHCRLPASRNYSRIPTNTHTRC